MSANLISTLTVEGLSKSPLADWVPYVIKSDLDEFLNDVTDQNGCFNPELLEKRINMSFPIKYDPTPSKILIDKQNQDYWRVLLFDSKSWLDSDFENEELVLRLLSAVYPKLIFRLYIDHCRSTASCHVYQAGIVRAGYTISDLEYFRFDCREPEDDDRKIDIDAVRNHLDQAILLGKGKLYIAEMYDQMGENKLYRSVNNARKVIADNIDLLLSFMAKMYEVDPKNENMKLLKGEALNLKKMLDKTAPGTLDFTTEHSSLVMFTDMCECFCFD